MYLVGAGSKGVKRDLTKFASFSVWKNNKMTIFTSEELKETIVDPDKARTDFVFVREFTEYSISSSAVRVLS